MNGVNLPVEYKVHKYRYDNFHKFEEIIKQSLDFLGYNDSDISSVKHIPAVNVYNHCHKSEISTDNNIIFKPTAFINVDLPQAFVPNNKIPSFSSFPKRISFFICKFFFKKDENYRYIVTF